MFPDGALILSVIPDRIILVKEKRRIGVESRNGFDADFDLNHVEWCDFFGLISFERKKDWAEDSRFGYCWFIKLKELYNKYKRIRSNK